ncbi:PP2C family protein-serine/threonine phosphatase [Pseudothauera rhizosphaerae]|uniref:Serine/threonine-protein phosphatase n=1 Tax=Pseudothauera rhizosphaerae TaxID=2565932 RepID=A0A4S4APX4_9RHOO|nr:protein phosphatase 2C domain-containing protein [Pseudothauera rhizosphaerae]THF60483.1 serine/threonine-protein phosphatase [Pseudothauera rhizosphaerae]
MPLTIETCVARHTGDRKEQQDRVALFAHPTLPGTMMAVLADGMGGHSGGAMAAEQVLIKAKQNFEAYAPRSETPEHLLDSVVNEAHVVIKLTRFTSEQDPHSTAVVLMLQPGRADWVHCGDSRLYHFRSGELVSRTKDHSLVGELQRQGRIDETAALRHPQRNVLLSCLGSEREPDIEHGRQMPLKAGDSFLLCSDGLWTYFSDEELCGAVAALPTREAAQTLVTRARERADGYGDNISVAIIKLVEAPVRSARAAHMNAW